MTPAEAAEAGVRPYEVADRPAVRRIAYETGLFGAPADPLVPDRELFADLWTVAYTDGLPGEALVATVGSEVVGYLLGAPDPRAATRAFLGRVAPLVLGRSLRGKYRGLGASLPFLGRLALEPAPHAPSDRFPAHLHMNLLPAARGRKLGLALLRAYLGRLSAAGVAGVQLSTTDRNAAAVRLYEGLGFSVWASRDSGLYRGIVPGPVRRLAMARSLGPPSAAVLTP